MIALDSVQSPDADVRIEDLPIFLQTGLQVRDVMSKVQFIVSADSCVLDAAQIMTNRRTPFVAVEEGGSLSAIVTEREIARGAAKHGCELRDMKVGEIMAPLPPGISPECPITEAAQVMHAHRLRWFPVVAGSDVISILTQADLTRAATLLPELGDVAGIMSTDIITIGAERPLCEAARIMSDRNISCLVATHQNKLAGVLTEADLLDQVVATEQSWAPITVADVMSFPVVSIEPDCSLSEARAVMDRTHVHRLVIVDLGLPCGLITQTDITRALDQRLREQEHRRWRRLANSPDAIFAVDLDGNTVYVNRAFSTLLEYPHRETCVGQPFLPLCSWSNPADREPFMAVFRSKDLQVHAAHLKTHSGKSLRVAVFSTIAKNFRGEVIGKQGIVWPVTHDDT